MVIGINENMIQIIIFIYYEDLDGKIVDNRPSNSINENIDPEEKYINGLSNIINPPYFYNLKVTDTPESLWNRILSKVFNQEVRVNLDYIIDSNKNRIYYEDSDGFWYKREYDLNNNEIYYENSNGHWEKKEFDSNNNIIYHENSDGFWSKREYDSNNNVIYFENSNGKIIDKRNINENVDPEEKYVNGIVKFINVPYFYNLRVTDTPEHLWDRILSKVFNQEVRVDDNYIFDSNNNLIYLEYSNGDWEKREYDSNNNIIYLENSNGYWFKQEYDSNNNEIYYEDSDGSWSKREYDSNNNEIYYENSNGYWRKREYDLNNNEIYYENSDGDWSKKEYDSNNNEIYFENSDGEWYKQEFDKNNNEIYFENSDGRIIDKRNINENIDPEEKYISGIVKFINIPYFYNLRVTDTPESLWNRILSKVFNQEVTVENKYIFDSNNNKIYYENSDGFWYKQEYDSNNNLIYHENSDGYWFKREYDLNNNEIYFEDSRGSWSKREYDLNNNEIYYENSNGEIIDNRSNNPINENIDITPEEKYVNGLSNIINPPYFYNLKVTDTPEHLWNRILSKKFKQEVRVENDYIFDSNNNVIYFEDSTGDWRKREYDSNNNIIYHENSDGYWYKEEYDLNNNRIYRENSDGSWYKQEYDSNNNIIYYEDSDGVIRDKRNINENIDPEEKYVNGLSSIINVPYFYNLKVTDTPEHLWNRILSKVFNLEVGVNNNGIYDSNNNEIYYEDSDGYWVKKEYDSNNNQIYYENSEGDWFKQEYDSNNNRIYYENSTGDWEKKNMIQTIIQFILKIQMVKLHIIDQLP
jgi:hypothetical protein